MVIRVLAALLFVLFAAAGLAAERGTSGIGAPQGEAAKPGGPSRGGPQGGFGLPGPGAPGRWLGLPGLPLFPGEGRVPGVFSDRAPSPGLAPRVGATPLDGPVARLPRPQNGGRLSSDDLAQHLASRGFRDVSNVRVRGEHFIVDAVGPRGERVTIVVNAATREVAGVRVKGER